MSELSRGPLALFPVPSGPPVPERSPLICEAVPGGPRAVPTVVQVVPVPPPYRGDRGPDRLPTAITGASRKAQIRVHSCHAPILAGLDADVAALSVAVDPYPLTPLGEVEALRDSRRTYDLRQMRLDRRDHWTIPGHPPSPRHPVVAEHRCGHPIPDDWKAPPAPPAPTPEEF